MVHIFKISVTLEEVFIANLLIQYTLFNKNDYSSWPYRIRSSKPLLLPPTLTNRKSLSSVLLISCRLFNLNSLFNCNSGQCLELFTSFSDFFTFSQMLPFLHFFPSKLYFCPCKKDTIFSSLLIWVYVSWHLLCLLSHFLLFESACPVSPWGPSFQTEGWCCFQGETSKPLQRTDWSDPRALIYNNYSQCGLHTWPTECSWHQPQTHSCALGQMAHFLITSEFLQ